MTQLTTFANVRRVSIHVLECRLENFVTPPLMVEMESANAHRLSLLVVYLVKLVFLELVNAEQPRLVRIYQQESRAVVLFRMCTLRVYRPNANAVSLLSV